MAKIALTVIVYALICGTLCALRTFWLARRRKTRWTIFLIRWDNDRVLDWVCNPESGAPPTDLADRTQILWDTPLPDEIAIHHIPKIGSTFAGGLVESVRREDVP